jgi:hypothetical protein
MMCSGLWDLNHSVIKQNISWLSSNLQDPNSSEDFANWCASVFKKLENPATSAMGKQLNVHF